MTARHGPSSVGGEPGVDALLRTSCPSDLGAVLVAVQRVLPWALVYRGDTYHLKSCRDAGVNTRKYGCSDKCIETQVVVAWVGQSVERCRQHAVGPARQGGFWETEARTG